MKNTVNDIKGKINDQNLKRKVFFIFYGIFFFFLFLYMTFGGGTKKDEEKKEDEDNNNNVIEKTKDIINNTDNYSFSHTVNINGKEILLYGSVYNNEMIIYKEINNNKTTFYKFYDELYILDNNKYIRYEGNIIDNFDIKLINPEYLEDILKNSIKEEKTNLEVTYFNSSANILFTFNYSEDNTLNNILVTKGEVNVRSKYYNEGKVEKFNIKIEE